MYNNNMKKQQALSTIVRTLNQYQNCLRTISSAIGMLQISGEELNQAIKDLNDEKVKKDETK